MNRRAFVRMMGAAGALHSKAGAATTPVGIVQESSAGPVGWALRELEGALSAHGVKVRRYRRKQDVPAGTLLIVTRPGNGAAESLAIGSEDAGAQIVASGADSRGLTYAVLELADRVRHAEDPVAALRGANRREQPAVRIRSIARLFTSEVHDKPWFYDREMWPRYLDLLATNRFNRFNLSFGIGYDFLQNVTDAYFLFAYPFLLAVPGYQVKAAPLADAERERNLAMLRSISEQTSARGMEFQLGLWMHGYRWLNSPHPNYTIEGLNAENHGPYCRDAVRLLLQQCPAISGITFR
ncbi:MAG TPA: hypothetical protein VG672_11800, partial [Bryobacteraceae bacterium]|nr:hypothetical protein [Bryobacteraceae bacterium]